MTNATINKTMIKLEKETERMSLGFKRFFVLPNRVKKAMITAHFLNTGETNYHSDVVSFFQNLSKTEYKTWLKNA